MHTYRFSKVYLQSIGTQFPVTALSSAEIEDRIAPLYQRLEIPFGTLEKLSGVRSRFMWQRDVMPSSMASEAASHALDQLPFSKEHIGAVINCSVTRDYFEPATACLVHRALGLPEHTIAFDITNACIGFSNGLLMLSQLIEGGVIKAGLIVSAETIAPVVEATMSQLLTNETISREQLLRLLPTFTLGCGAVAWVLCDESLATSGHKFVGAVARSATQHSDLCSGDRDYQMSGNQDTMPLMYTDSAKLMASAAKLGGRMFQDFSKSFEWTKKDVDHVFCHQVGKQVNDGFYREMGLDIAKEFTIYRDYGNLVSAALPSAVALGAEEKPVLSGQKILLTAYGSGLNSIFSGFVW